MVNVTFVVHGTVLPMLDAPVLKCTSKQGSRVRLQIPPRV